MDDYRKLSGEWGKNRKVESRAKRSEFQRVTEEGDRVRPSPGKKDTKRWCLGKVGREHVKKSVKLERRIGQFISVEYNLKCATCGKIFDFWWPSTVPGMSSSKKPDWVVIV